MSFNEIFAHVAKLNIMNIFSYRTSFDLNINQLDVNRTILNREFEEATHINQFNRIV